MPARPLLGRGPDVAAVAKLLGGSGVRLVTLTGAGGIGKTRLAVTVAERVGPMMAHGVAFVPLAAVLDRASLWLEIGRALGLDATDGAEGAETVVSAAAPLEALLVLDSCEHLAVAAGVVTELLDHCPGLTVLVTSRAPLRVPSESEYSVPPLQLPPLDVREPAALAASPAASLLVARARAVRRDFEVRHEDVASVVRLCHRLAGLPLALELAAAGLRVLDPPALLDRLDDALTCVGPVDLPVRQRTLRGTLDWSYEQLSQGDQAVFRRAAVFVGGFSLAALESVGGESDVLGATERILAQSLWMAAPSADGSLRYEMLEPVGQYARSLLGDDEEIAVRRAHAEYFVTEAENARPGLDSAGLRDSLRLLDTEDANLWAAAEWAARNNRADLTARFTWALFVHWWIRGRRERGRRYLADVLASAAQPVLPVASPSPPAIPLSRRPRDRPRGSTGQGLSSHRAGTGGRIGSDRD